LNRRRFLRDTLSILALTSGSRHAAELNCDVAVIGGGLGGCAAAIAALQKRMRVILTEETDWIGGQCTAQAVPPDEHPWIEQYGCTRSYRMYRNAVRDYYRSHFPLSERARAVVNLNPGNATVSALAHEPRVSVAVLQALLAPYITSAQLLILLEHVAEQATTVGDDVTSVTVRDLNRGDKRTIIAKYFLDATELGDVLPLTNTEFVTGAESRAQTGESHAASEPQPGNSQAFTFCFAMDYLDGEDHTIDQPGDYSKWRSYVPQLAPPWTGRLVSWTFCDPRTLAPKQTCLDPNFGSDSAKLLNLWTYRRIADRRNFMPGAYRSDITLVNWPQNDFWSADLVTASAEQKRQALKSAKELSLSLLYWMQTEAPRLDGGHGFKGLRLRKDVTGTEDGLAKAAYIRESRRIEAEFTVREQHVGAEMRRALLRKSKGELSAERFSDSVGIGYYRIDLHPSAGGTNYIDIGSLPFQIPLGSLTPKRVNNLLPACKNIGTTHVTNGCYRLHPVEWNIGEAAGALAAHAVETRQIPRAIRNSSKLLENFQNSLRAQGFELTWTSDVVPPEH
jgi:hypothetical protein